MSGADPDDGDERGGSVREQDRFLPIANISRIMKKALPPNAKIAKDAKETVQECVSEFISFITSECGFASLAGSCTLAFLRRASAGNPRCVLASAAHEGVLQAKRASWVPALPPDSHVGVLRQGQRQVPAGEAENDKRRRLAVGHEHTWVRGVRGAIEDIPSKVPRGAPCAWACLRCAG